MAWQRQIKANYVWLIGKNHLTDFQVFSLVLLLFLHSIGWRHRENSNFSTNTCTNCTSQHLCLLFRFLSYINFSHFFVVVIQLLLFASFLKQTMHLCSIYASCQRVQHWKMHKKVFTFFKFNRSIHICPTEFREFLFYTGIFTNWIRFINILHGDRGLRIKIMNTPYHFDKSSYVV